MSNRKRFSWRFALKLLIIMFVLGIVIALFVEPLIITCRFPGNNGFFRLRAIEAALDQHRMDTFKYPDSLDGLIKNTVNSPRWDGPYLKPGIPKDPWGNDYQYKKPGREGRDYDLYSFGADGREGGEGDNADIHAWEVEGK
jgi:general secretion pathway protein G